MTTLMSVTIPCYNSCELHTHFKPEGKPAPPRPRRPEALISEMICTCQHILVCHVSSNHTQSWPLSRISLVLCQSPYFMALLISAPWWPYKFWKILSWSFKPPYVLTGFAFVSFTVARVRFCVREGAAVERRVAAEAAGRARWAAALSADEAGACRASIVNAILVLTGAIDARAAGERTWSLEEWRSW
jgi:hypothetical protein